MKSMILALLLAMGMATPASSRERDPILDAMQDELGRSMQSLKIEKHEKPYYISYHIDDRDSWNADASFGALDCDVRNHNRSGTVDVHVGDYKLDSGNYQHGFGMFFFIRPDQQVSVDDDYDAIRHKLWLQTDEAYKRAVQNLESKKSDLQQKIVKERPDDWSRETKVEEVKPKLTLTIDSPSWQKRLKALSAIFCHYPSIRSSNVRFSQTVENEYFINSEGSQCRQPHSQCLMVASATAQADDGLQVSDTEVIAAADAEHLPSMQEIEARLNSLAQRVCSGLKGKEAELYQGPVLFEGQAAAQFFQAVLAPHVGAFRGSDTDDFMSRDNPLQARIGKRILPTSLTVIDDPSLEDDAGLYLPSSRLIDCEGVPAQKVQLVDEGILQTLLSTRLPTAKVKNSNGHSSGSGNARMTNLIVQSAAPLDAAQLKEKLMQLGKDEGVDYVVIVRKLGSGRFGSGFVIFSGFGAGNDSTTLPPPLSISKLYLSDGHEEPIRNADFADCTVKVLREIADSGNDNKRYFFDAGDSVTSITTPSILVSDMEIRKSHGSIDKPPVIPHPYFEKAQLNN